MAARRKSSAAPRCSVPTPPATPPASRALPSRAWRNTTSKGGRFRISSTPASSAFTLGRRGLFDRPIAASELIDATVHWRHLDLNQARQINHTVRKASEEQQAAKWPNRQYGGRSA